MLLYMLVTNFTTLQKQQSENSITKLQHLHSFVNKTGLTFLTPKIATNTFLQAQLRKRLTQVVLKQGYQKTFFIYILYYHIHGYPSFCFVIFHIDFITLTCDLSLEFVLTATLISF